GRVGLPRARRGPPPLAIRPPPGTAATVTRPAPSSRIRGSTTSWSARTGRAAAGCNRSGWAAPPRWTVSGHRIISPWSPNSSSRAGRAASGDGERERLARVVHQHCLDLGVAEAGLAEHDGDGGEQMVVPQAAVALEALLEPDVHAEQQLAEVARAAMMATADARSASSGSRRPVLS